MFGKLQTPSPYHEAPPPSAGPAPGPPPLHPPPDLSEYLRSANGAADVQNQQMQPYIGPVPSSKPSSSPDGQVQLPEGSNDVDQAGAAWISSAFCFDQYHGEQQVSSDQQMYDANQYYSNQYHQPEQQSQLALPHQLQPFYDQYNASQYHEQYYNWFYAQPEYMQHAATAQQQHYPDYYGAAALVQYGYPSQSPASWAAPESATAPESLAVDILDGAESFVIGPRGAHVNAMQAETGCRVRVQPSVDRRSRAQTASISGGDASARARCAALVQAKIAEFYDTQHEQRAPYAQGHAGRGAYNSESRNASASATGDYNSLLRLRLFYDCAVPSCSGSSSRMPIESTLLFS
uniref:K Homology domain-containing protein n=1 Tax=Chrysotila carterae TaxID=13221 RepID=A0A7S4B3H6_CHRCT